MQSQARNTGALVAVALLAAWTAAMPTGPLRADEITLRVKGGGLEVKGELKSFDGVNYVIEAPQFGAMTFDASRVECIGAGCGKRVQAPQPTETLDPASPDTVAIQAMGPLGLEILPALVKGYAKTIGASVTQVIGANAGEARLRLEDAGGALLATFVVQSSAAEAVSAEGEGPAIVISDHTIEEQSGSRRQGGAGKGEDTAKETVLASDGLVVVVAPDNALVSIPEDKLARVLAGKLTTWVDVGVSGGKINVYAVDRASSVMDVVTSELLKPRGLSLADTAIRVANEAALADAVTRDANGIGITSAATLRNAKRLNIEGSCGLITRPTTFAVKAGEYPLKRRIYLSFRRGGAQPAARGLVRYATSAEAQQVITETGLVNQSVEPLPLDEQKGRMGHAINAPSRSFDLSAMRELLNDIKGLRRLSVTFRFAGGGPDLDTASRREVGRLAELLAGADYVGKRVLLIGFTDLEGKFSANQNASARRAGQVRTQILAAAAGRIDGATIGARGYGPLAPVACSDSSERRALNRRVEVWVAE